MTLSSSPDDADTNQNSDTSKNSNSSSSSSSNNNSDDEHTDQYLLEEREEEMDSLEDILGELEALGVGDYYEDYGDEDLNFLDGNDLQDFFDSLEDDELDMVIEEIENGKQQQSDEDTYANRSSASSKQQQQQQQLAKDLLENALLQGVVPANAGVGSNVLPGDYNFDPLNLASKDYFPQAQAVVQKLLLLKNDDDTPTPLKSRPQALILRDYREAEIRHGRLAMLAATFWPLQELLDRLVLPEDKFNSLLNSLFFGGVTLPYFPLIMTAIMLLLGYLDIYSQAIKEVDKIGEAFLPGDCFWDPLSMLTGAPDQMKRNMQERELFNGRFAMLAIAVFIWEESRTGKPLISIEGNEILFEPAYQVPFVQKWLDSRFSSPSPIFYNLDEDAARAITSTELLVSKMGDVFQLIIN